MTVGLPISEPAPPCIQCGYNLTGLTSPRCPECGWVIDWELARASDEARRPGTPVHQARGRARLWAIPSTVLLLLFRPVHFARRLRHDEPLWPAITVAVSAYLVAFLPDTFIDMRPAFRMHPAFFSAIVGCVLCNTIGFVVLTTVTSPPLGWGRRLRLFILLSLYSSCFIAGWGVVDGPPYFDGWRNANFLWPANQDIGQDLAKLTSDHQFVGRTVLMYWWVAILVVLVFVRTNSKWRAALFLLAPFLAAWLASWVGAFMFNALHL